MTYLLIVLAGALVVLVGWLVQRRWPPRVDQRSRVDQLRAAEQSWNPLIFLIIVIAISVFMLLR